MAFDRARLCAAVLSAFCASAAASASTRSLGQVVLEDVPEIPAALAARMLQYQNTRAADFLGFDPDGGGVLIRTRFGETPQLHWVKKPGGARRQLSFLAEPVASAALRPALGSRELVYAMDAGGSENYQLHLLRLKDGSSTLLTDGKSRHQSALWSKDGARLIYNGTARNGKDFDFYLYDAASGRTRLLKEVEGQWYPLDWSLDGRRLLVMRYVSINETYPHLLDIETGRLEPLRPRQEPRQVAYGTARWMDGDQVLLTCDEGGEFMSLARLDPRSGELAWMTQGIPWDVEAVEVSRDGQRAAFTVNEDGVSRLYLGPSRGPFRPVGVAPRGVLSGLAFSRDGSRLGLTANTPSSPGDVYVLDWTTRRFERWTESETGGLPVERFVEPELVRFPSFDQVDGKSRLIPAFYYRPRSAGHYPVVVSIHGGPEGQERPVFNPTYQYWLNELGVAVLVPNVRGSSGYGKSYLLLDNGRRREDSVKDIGALLDWVAARPELNKSRVAVYGGSYGGYMVLASLARFGERLKAGVDVVGISNFVTFLKNTSSYRRDLRRAEYGDERDPGMAAFLESISPTTLAGRITSALFVAQGANDPRVPASEAEQIVRVVRGNGRKAWSFLAKDEGHGFQKKTNRDLMGQSVSLFWQSHLLPAATN